MINHKIRCRTLAPGIIRIVIPHPYPPANVYFLQGNPPVLVDAGHPGTESYRALREAIRSLDCAPEKLGAIVYTHPHRDHLGGGLFLRVPGWIHHQAVEGLANLDESSLRENVLRLDRARYIFGSDGGHPFTSADFDRYMQSRSPMRGSIPVKGGLREGDCIRLGDRTWTVLETPGHHRHHLCLYDSTDGILLTGDAVIRHIITVGDDTDEYLASLRKLAGLNCRLMLPGHGAAIDRPSDAVADLIDLTGRRRDFIIELLSREPLSVPHIMNSLFPRLPHQYGAYQSIAGQLLPFLRALESEGRITKHEENGRITFHPAAMPES